MRIAQPSRKSRVKKGDLRCAFCGGTDHVELHHVGGRFHIGWFLVPLCRLHHVRVTAMLRMSGVDMRYTPDKRERIARARKAALAFLWMLQELERGPKR